MTDPKNPDDRLGTNFLLWLVLGVSVVFVAMIRQFLVSVLLAGIFAAMLTPLHERLTRALRGRSTAAAALTVLAACLLVFAPATAFLGIVAAQAFDVTQNVRPWIEQQLKQPDQIEAMLRSLPFADRFSAIESFLPERATVIARMGDAVSFAGTFLMNSAASVTRGTTSFVLQLFIMLYAMFNFLLDGRRILDQILYYMPLNAEDEAELVDKFVSVTRATLRGSLVIGTLQGALGGIAFWVAGLDGSAFWGTVMAVLSVIPGVGAALIWIPVVAYLLVIGQFATAAALAAWCAIVVGTIDNFLRPRLVGRDAKMSDLMILLSTLGGIFMFGAVGFILGPIVAALFVAVWELYGRAFEHVLPPIDDV